MQHQRPASVVRHRITFEISLAYNDGRYSIRVHKIRVRIAKVIFILSANAHVLLVVGVVAMCCVCHSIIPIHYIIIVFCDRRRHWKLKFIQTNYVRASDLHCSTISMDSRAFLDEFVLYFTHILWRISDSMITSVAHSTAAIIIIITILVDLLFEFFMISLIFISFSVQLSFIGYRV